MTEQTDKTIGLQELNRLLLEMRKVIDDSPNAGGDIDYTVATDLIDEQLYCKHCGKRNLKGELPELLLHYDCAPPLCPRWQCRILPIIIDESKGLYKCPEHGNYQVNLN